MKNSQTFLTILLSINQYQFSNPCWKEKYTWSKKRWRMKNATQTFAGKSEKFVRDEMDMTIGRIAWTLRLSKKRNMIRVPPSAQIVTNQNSVQSHCSWFWLFTATTFQRHIQYSKHVVTKTSRVSDKPFLLNLCQTLTTHTPYLKYVYTPVLISKHDFRICMMWSYQANEHFKIYTFRFETLYVMGFFDEIDYMAIHIG